MTGLNFLLAQATSTTNSNSPFGNIFGGNGMIIIMMVVFIGFFYFVIVRPQNKKKKEMESMLKNMKPGDKVVTIGGAHGKIVSVKDDTITIKVDDKAEITFEKSAISRVIDPNAKPKTIEKKDKKNEVVEKKVEDSATEQKQ
jgi:preprotein translocase subunit YajC